MSLYKDKKTCFISAGSFHFSGRKHTPTNNDESLNALSLPHSILKTGDGNMSTIHFYEAIYRPCALDIKT